MEGRKARYGRDEWRQRVERWRESGLSAEAFAAELGTKPATLKFWKYRLRLEKKGGEKRNAQSLEASALVEVRGFVATDAAPFVLELSASRRLQIPTAFDERALERLLTVLERR